VPGHWLLDVQDDEPSRLDDELDWDPVVFHGAWPRAWCLDPPDDGDVLCVREGFTMLGAHTDFFGHWMCEYLPKYVAARLSGLLPDVPVLIDSHMPASHREALERLYRPVAIIEVPAFRVVHVERLWCAPTLSYYPLHEVRNEHFGWDAVSASAERFEPIVRDLQRRLDSIILDTHRGSRVYLARKMSRHRRLMNAAEVETVARELGFEVAFPEDMAFVDQAALLRDAELVIAPEGSAIFLAMFSRPSTTLLILSHPLTDVLADCNSLFGSHGVRVLAMTGPIVQANESTAHDSDYRIDVNRFRSLVASLFRVGGPDVTLPV
jgi:capsular polysaccharide biosynthesis protein